MIYITKNVYHIMVDSVEVTFKTLTQVTFIIPLRLDEPFLDDEVKGKILENIPHENGESIARLIYNGKVLADKCTPDSVKYNTKMFVVAMTQKPKKALKVEEPVVKEVVPVPEAPVAVNPPPQANPPPVQNGGSLFAPANPPPAQQHNQGNEGGGGSLFAQHNAEQNLQQQAANFQQNPFMQVVPIIFQTLIKTLDDVDMIINAAKENPVLKPLVEANLEGFKAFITNPLFKQMFVATMAMSMQQQGGVQFQFADGPPGEGGVPGDAGGAPAGGENVNPIFGHPDLTDDDKPKVQQLIDTFKTSCTNAEIIGVYLACDRNVENAAGTLASF
jgi:hypothetical protein